MARLAVRLLGGFRVELDGEPVYGFETDKARALLAYLMVEADRPHRRETLAGLLWPDRTDAAARNSLRHTLFRVRQALTGHEAPGTDRVVVEPAPFLFVTSMDVQFNTDQRLQPGRGGTGGSCPPRGGEPAGRRIRSRSPAPARAILRRFSGRLLHA